METRSFILVVGSMKQFCLNCDKVFYVSEGNYRGYPQCWGQEYYDNELQIKEREGNNARTREDQTELTEAPSA